jgi:hypothetical protein
MKCVTTEPNKLDKAGVGEEGYEKKGKDGQTEMETRRRDGLFSAGN